ncbi:hypothetical protein TEA_019048 [Camellia sinensis var. sinensis]|uniref:Homeobox domain-containing protein n=1 Tax=Camellia sinensis var. sinensis TaxID=542762 RepID=A0A4V3WQB7_CAMSN|nr:hypothetical protein TEA_019048 [Camellia sinensis var. sinensis]
MVSEDICNTGLTLGSAPITTPENHLHSHHHHHQHNKKLLSLKFDHVLPCLTLGLSSEEQKIKTSVKIDACKVHGESTISLSAVSSYSNSSVKRERDEEVENQKQALAKQLNLRPRQVEVWFQNRRARTKLKQTEIDCESLKNYCAKLKDENRRLQKELQELKAPNVAAPFYMQLPAATLTMCPSCERIGSTGGSENSSKSLFSIGAKHHFYSPFTHPSAAC